MITLEELIKKAPVYYDGFRNKQEVEKEFEETFEGNVLFAFYQYENYSGDAFVLFEKRGKLYEVHGSHCSCYGLEGQFNPEETTIENIIYRQKNKGHRYSPYTGLLKTFLEFNESN